MTVAYENNNQQDRSNDSVFSKRLKAGKRRTYFFDVKTTRGNDYFLTITESKKRFNDNGYDRHKIFLYKEDFNKFLNALTESVDYVKTELMPDFDFDAFNHDNDGYGSNGENAFDHGSDHQENDHQHDDHEDSRQNEQQQEDDALETAASAEEVPATVVPSSAPSHDEDVDKW